MIVARIDLQIMDYDPSPKIPFPGNSGGSSDSLGALSANKVPNKEDWDINQWLEEGSDECNDFEEVIQSDSLPVKVNFEYTRDGKGNPTLLVPNMDSTRTMPGRTFNRVEYDQTLSHLHHLPELGMELPPGFDMGVYKNLSTKAAKIEYGKKHLSPETIISYQNTIGLRMSPVFGSGIKTYAFRGFAGKNRAHISLVIQSIPNSSDYYMSIVNDRGIHISSYPIRKGKLTSIIKDDFWILQKRNFN